MRGNGKEEYGWPGKKRLFRRMDMGMGMIPQRLPYGGMTRIRFEGTVSTVAGTPASTVIVAENGWRRAAVCEQGLPRPKVA